MKPLHEIDADTVARLVAEGHTSQWFPRDDVAVAMVRDVMFYFNAADIGYDASTREGQMFLSAMGAMYTNAMRVGFQAAAEQVQGAPPPS